MNKFGKMVAVGLASALAFSLCACGDKDSGGNSGGSNKTTVKTERINSEEQWDAAFDFAENNGTCTVSKKTMISGHERDTVTVYKYDGNKISVRVTDNLEDTVVDYYYSFESDKVYEYEYNDDSKKWFVSESSNSIAQTLGALMSYDGYLSGTSYDDFGYSNGDSAYVCSLPTGAAYYVTFKDGKVCEIWSGNENTVITYCRVSAVGTTTVTLPQAETPPNDNDDDEKNDDDDDDKTLNLTVWCPADAMSAYKNMVVEYKASHIEAKEWNVTFFAKGDGVAASEVSVHPEAGPNIYFLASDQIDKNVAQGALQPLTTEYVNKIKARDGAGAVDAAKVGDNYYAFPNANSNGYFLIYDKNLYSEDDIKSLDTMVAKAQDAGKKILFNYDDGFYNPTFFFGMGVGLGDTASNNEVFEPTDADAIEAGRTYVKYFGTGANDVFITSVYNNAIAVGFQSGTLAAGVMGTWCNEGNALYKMAETTPGWTKDRIGFAKLPKFTDMNGTEYQMGSFMGAKYCGVNPAKTEEEIVASLALADFFNAKENQIARYLATGDCPTNNEAAQDPRVTSDPMLAALAAQNAAGGHMQLATPENFWDALATFGSGIYLGYTTQSNIAGAVALLSANLKGSL